MIYVAFMAWTVISKKKAQKQAQKLPSDIKKILARLLMEIEIAGPFRSNWQSKKKAQKQAQKLPSDIKKIEGRLMWRSGKS
jgi:mRNA-degrading endonuclease RelE of RelBE toxin-antitoxin system